MFACTGLSVDPCLGMSGPFPLGSVRCTLPTARPYISLLHLPADFVLVLLFPAPCPPCLGFSPFFFETACSQAASWEQVHGVLRPCISENILHLYSYSISNLAGSRILHQNLFFFRILKVFMIVFQFALEQSRASLIPDLLDVTIFLLEAWEIFFPTEVLKFHNYVLWHCSIFIHCVGP